MALQITETQKIQQESAQQTFPDITFRKIDEAVVEYFDKKYPLLIDGRKVPVIFAGPERWAQVQRDSYLKDKDGMLILPVIVVRRLSPEINLNRHVPKQPETNIVVKKSKTNKLDFVNKYNKNRQIYDCYLIPYPRFITMNYTIIIWTSHFFEMNEIQERYLNLGSHYFFSKDKFWFSAHIQSINDNSNTEDNTRQERIQKVEYSLTLDAYLSDPKEIKKIPSINSYQITELVDENDSINETNYKFSMPTESNPIRNE